MNILQINNISKKYGNTQALDNLSLYIKKGDVFGILGPNGSGKTTILGIILCIIKQNSGSFRWIDSEENKIATTNIGALLETPNFYPYLSLYKNLQIAATIKNVEYIDNEIERVLKEVGLFERQFSQYRTLSLGMKQRLALASVLLSEPDILILDEPTNGLDPRGIADVRNILIEQAKKGKTIILASHILDEVEKTCSHVAILKKGKLLKQGKIIDMLKTERQITVEADELDNLFELIVKSNLSKRTEIVDNQIIITLADDIDSKEINKFAFKHDIVLTKFEEKKVSLETEFLKIVEQP